LALKNERDVDDSGQAVAEQITPTGRTDVMGKTDEGYFFEGPI